MSSLEGELRRSLYLRLDALLEHIAERKARIGTTNPTNHVLNIVEKYPRYLKIGIDNYCAKYSSSQSRIELLRLLLNHTTAVIMLVEDRLSHDTYSDTPLYLLTSMRHACLDMKLDNLVPILTVGSANSFDSDIDDIEERVYGDSSSRVRRFFQQNCPSMPARFDDRRFVLFGAPRMEGQSLLWAPIILGHELAHRVITRNTLSRLNRELWLDYGDVDGELFKIAESWTVEAVCDAYAVRAFGICGLASMAEYLEVVGHIDRVGKSHPPVRLRIQLMLDWLGDIPESLEPIVEPWNELIISNEEAYKLFPRQYQHLVDVLVEKSDLLLDSAREIQGSDYDCRERSEAIVRIARDLELGMPSDFDLRNANELGMSSDGDISEADVITAAWLARARGFNTPYVELAKKSLEIRDFVIRWRRAGGVWKHDGDDAEDVAVAPESDGFPDQRMVLSSRQIRERIGIGDAESGACSRKRLVVRPCNVAEIHDASLDIRLGNQFIVFLRSRIGSFRPIQPEHDPRSIQRLIRLSWSDRFVLHPNELVLAATLEYLVLPADVTAQVITRSSYGRLGLLSATAIQVQPLFHGCLTLELVNLSTVPLELVPGERIAQLVFFSTEPAPSPSRVPKYQYTIGPQFSRVGLDSEVEVLRKFGDPMFPL